MSFSQATRRLRGFRFHSSRKNLDIDHESEISSRLKEVIEPITKCKLSALGCIEVTDIVPPQSNQQLKLK
jgi:hypothetical protein